MTVPLAAGLFHTGITVGDLTGAMQEMTERLGISWAEPVRRTGPVHTPAGPVGRDMVITYSLGGPHHIELVHYLDDAAYRHLTGGPPQHHVGFWAEDFHGEIARLERLGYPCECSGIGRDGGRREFAYHRDPRSNTWIELVDARRRAGFEAWTAPPGRPQDPDPPRLPKD